MDQVVVKRDDLLKKGIVYMVSTVISAIVFYYLRDQFARPYGIIVLAIAVALELLISVYTLLKAKEKTVLDGEGITVSGVFGTKTYTWMCLKNFEIGWNYGTSKAFGVKNEKLPYIRLVFSEPHRRLLFAWREDIDRCIRRYYGMPDRDSWTAGGK